MSLDLNELVRNLNEPKKLEPRCPGVFFRIRYSKYFDSKGNYLQTTKFVKLKRLSCKGCQQCDWLRDDLMDRNDSRYAVIVPDVKDGTILELKATNWSKDWETGHYDDWDLEFVPVEIEPKVLK